MKSIRNFAYAILLALTMLNFAPSLAAVQEPASGKFTLSHDVHWQSAFVPAGDYQFSFMPDGVSSLLVLRKLSGASAGFMILVPDIEKAKPSDVSKLLLETTSAGSYVSAMQLPEFDMTPRFGVPSQTAEKQIAKAATTAMATAR